MRSKIEYVGRCLLLTSGKERVLVIGDLHLGFEESLNRSGILVTRMMLDETIKELDKIFGKIGEKVERVVLLGDIKHYFGGILKQEWGDVLKLFDYLNERCKKIVLIKGNHDMILGPIAKKAGLRLKNYWNWKDFCFTHGDEDYKQLWNKKIKCIIVGHGHPAIRLREGARSEKYKCFLSGRFRGKKLIVVPSFSEWYVGSDPREGEVWLAWDIDFGNFDVIVVGESLNMLDFGKLKKIK